MYMKHIFLALFLLTLSPLLAISVNAQDTAVDKTKSELKQVTDVAQVTTGEEGGIYTIIATIINIVLGFIGLITLIIVIVAGIQWMTSGGNEEKITAAKKRIISGVIGLAIILGAAVITNFVLDLIVTATTS